LLCSTPSPHSPALALLTAAKIGYHPTWVVTSVGSDPITLTGLVKNFSKGAAGASLLEGIVSGYYLPALSQTNDPWIKLFTQVHDKYIADLPMDGNVEYGLGVAYTFVDLMIKAGQNPTRQDVINTLNNGKVSRGLGIVPLGYSTNNHLGFLGERIFTITGGQARAPGRHLRLNRFGADKDLHGRDDRPARQRHPDPVTRQITAPVCNAGVVS